MVNCAAESVSTGVSLGVLKLKLPVVEFSLCR